MEIIMTVSNSAFQPEVIEMPAGTDEVVCDGGHGALGHPRVWYSFDGKDSVTCEYCGRIFNKS